MLSKEPEIEVTPVAGALGAEISGIDLSHDLDDNTVAQIRQALLEYLVIFFRDQDITPEQHLAFAERFGTPVAYPLVKGLEGFPEIIPVLKLEHETVNFGGLWHSDTTYKECPPLGSILLARELPPYGGDTLFANMYKAYEGLSDGMKEVLSGLKAINSSENPVAKSTRQARLDDSGKMPAETVLEAIHPVVRTHPETGRKALFINPGHTVRFEGMTEAESTPILDFLYQEQIKPEYTCRFVWRPGSIAFWDNRSSQHNPINDYHGYKRLLHRITLEGDRPF
ncbi:TauD/TfdA family dioxygenase [Sneathiella marina]|uniref:TauD/TfdA family dioxygenase n=1 Tax=Sneathiella marina TaxID=2950108 RepID=A0ABY4WD16_9PROT|nr:TauD/TfdA family dioxygenase [Sneathiella marina]USG62531.1 TauD/TfdA family dioxygenase [Sneathiella marina]